MSAARLGQIAGRLFAWGLLLIVLCSALAGAGGQVYTRVLYPELASCQISKVTP